MAEFVFFGTWEDTWLTLQFILDCGDIRLVPHIWYKRADYRTYNVLSPALKELLPKRAKAKTATVLTTDEF
jgi:hypothetical protein